MSTTIKKLFLLGFAAGTMWACGARAYYVSRAPVPPPPPRAAYRAAVAAPGPGYVWVDGYYDWRGRGYVWVPARYVKPPHSRAAWVPGHWAPRGGSFVWISARWR